MPEIDVVIPGVVPPSLNFVGSRGSRWAYIKAKKDLQQLVGDALIATQALPRRDLGRVGVTAVLTFPMERRRDEGNFRYLLEKVLGDALQAGGYIADDDAAHFRFGHVDFAKGPTCTTLTLVWP